MSKGLPVGGFHWLKWDEAMEWERIVESEGYGCFWRWIWNTLGKCMMNIMIFPWLLKLWF